MDAFTYTDIFDTKGIEYIIVIFFLLMIIPVWIILNRPLKLKARVSRAAGALTAAILRVPKGLLFSKNHTWTHMGHSGNARIGVDDLLLHLTGGVEVGFLQEQGTRIRKGDLLAILQRDGKKLEVTSPITGRVERVNPTLVENPGALKEDPYHSWLYEIEPENWKEETGRFLLAGEASRWIGEELSRFKDFLAETVHGGEGQASVEPVLQAGGELIDEPLSEMDQEVWSSFQSAFLTM